MNDIDRILELAGVKPLSEAVQHNIVNFRHDFRISDEYSLPSSIVAVRDTVYYELRHRGLHDFCTEDNQVVRWFQKNLLNWLPTINEAYVKLPMPEYIREVYWDVIAEENGDTRSIEEILASLPDYARSGWVMFPWSFDTVFDFSQENFANFPVNLPELLDYVIYEVQQGTNISRISVPDMIIKSEKWHAEKIKDGEGDAITIMDFSDGYRVAEVKTSEGLDYESNHCKHCIGKGGYDLGLKNGAFRVFSLRDDDNIPHVTMTVTGNVITQIQGHGNQAPPKHLRDHLMRFMSLAHLKFDKEDEYSRNLGLPKIDLNQ